MYQCADCSRASWHEVLSSFVMGRSECVADYHICTCLAIPVGIFRSRGMKLELEIFPAATDSRYLRKVGNCVCFCNCG